MKEEKLFANLDFNNIESLKNNGFVGFKTIRELMIDSSSIPKTKGVYIVLNTSKEVDFIEVGTGGFFKGKNPNVSVMVLEQNWIKNTTVVYIGKAGGEGSKATLYSRLKQYLAFGQGKSIGHWGGRFIWQLKRSTDLIICWKALPENDPRMIESDLISLFVSRYNKRPFANLRD